MHPLFHSVTRQTIDHELGRNCTGDDADALTNLENAKQAENFRRQTAKRTNRLSLESVERYRDAGVSDNGYAQRNKDTTDQSAHNIYEHATDGQNEYRHGLTPCDDAKCEKERNSEQDIAELSQVRIKHRNWQGYGLAPHRDIQISNTST